MNEPLTAARQAIYVDELSQLSHREVATAFDRAMKECTFFPKVGELMRLKQYEMMDFGDMAVRDDPRVDAPVCTICHGSKWKANPDGTNTVVRCDCPPEAIRKPELTDVRPLLMEIKQIAASKSLNKAPDFWPQNKFEAARMLRSAISKSECGDEGREILARLWSELLNEANAQVAELCKKSEVDQ